MLVNPDIIKTTCIYICIYSNSVEAAQIRSRPAPDGREQNTDNRIRRDDNANAIEAQEVETEEKSRNNADRRANRPAELLGIAMQKITRLREKRVSCMYKASE